MSREQQDVLSRARSDIDAGDLWKARDRLTMRAKQVPVRIDVLDLLGEVYSRMGDQPSAWRYWCLTDKQGPEVDDARAAFERSWGKGLGTRLRMTPVVGAFDDYPPAAQERLLTLQREAAERGIAWPSETERSEGEFERGLRFSAVVVLVGMLLLGPGIWLVGLVVLISLLVALL